VEVIDNGRGFNPEDMIDNRVRPDHIGLLSMKDRAELIGACLEIDSRSDEGTSISFTFCPASPR
jgi:signal transduction histidine kinase